MKGTVVTMLVLIIPLVLQGCSQTQAAQPEWEATLLDDSQPWTGGVSNWLSDDLNQDVYRFEANVPKISYVNVVWEYYRDGELVSRNDGSSMALESGVVLGGIATKQNDDSLRVRFAVNGNGTGLTFRSWKKLRGTQLVGFPGVISDATNPKPFFAFACNTTEASPPTAENMYQPEMHDQVLYLYVIRE